MAEVKTLNEADLLAVEAKRKECVKRGRPYATSWGEIGSFVLTIRELWKWQRDVQEREAAVCPEDVPFDEYIRVLERKLQEQSLHV